MPKQFDWWYLSFVDHKKGWLGACCVEAKDLHDAVKTAWKAGCNPGGEVLALALRDGLPVPDPLKYKLVTDAAIIELLLGEVVRIVPEGPCADCGKDV